ncbi:hypothetical protein R3P38DRAFT_3400477, partial [Favolaschia claudopus]
MYIKTIEEFEDFRRWIRTLPDPDGAIKAWWDHKEMHRWLLPAIIQCLSGIPKERWHIMAETTNGGEAQHALNNAEAGTRMGLVESLMQYEILDTRRAAE